MRKWTYLVAALLMGGATATFTSCIDTDEPAGITELRGAKAEFLRAKAAYQDACTQFALVQVERERVQLELDNVTLQIEQLKIAKEQAQNEYDLAVIQNKMEQLAEQQKASMAGLKEQTATAEKQLQEALNDLELAMLKDRDDKFQAAIQTAISEVQGLRRTINSTQTTIDGLNGRLIDLRAGLGESYRKGLVADSLALEKGLENQKFSLEQVQALADFDFNKVSEEVTAIDNQIAEIEAQALEITKQIATIQEAINPVTNEIAQIETEYADPKNDVVIPVDKVPAAIQEKVIAILSNTFIPSTSPSVYWAEKAVAPFCNEDGDVMTADFVTEKTSLKNPFGASWVELDQIIDNLITEVNNAYEPNFIGTYNRMFGTSFTEVSPEMIAMAKTKVAELEMDAAKSYTTFQADSLAWDKAYKAYKAAADAYGYQYNPYDKTAEVLNNYWSSPASEKPTWAEIKKALKDYYAVSLPLFGNSEIIKVPVGSENVPLSDVLDSYGDGELQLVLDANQSVTDYLGSRIDLSDKKALITLPSDEKDYGALHTYLAASQTVWGTGLTLGEARVTAATEDEYDAVTTPASTWKDYMDDATDLDVFKNIESWIALEDLLKAQSDTYQAAIEDIELRVNEKQMAIAVQQDQIWKLEFDRYALNEESLSFGNPYNVTSVVGKKQSLDALRSSIILSADNASRGATFTVYVYDFDEVTRTGTWKQMSDSKDNLVAFLEGGINDATLALDEAKAAIEKYDAGLDDGAMGTTIATLERQLDAAEKDLAENKANLERAEATLKNLLEAYANPAE